MRTRQDWEAAATIAIQRGITHFACLLDAKGIIRWLSPSVRQMVGVDPDVFVGRSIVDVVVPEDRSIARLFLKRATQVPQPQQFAKPGNEIAFDVRLELLGRPLTVEVMINNLLGNEDVQGILIIGRESTSRRTLDEGLEQLASDPADAGALERFVRYIDQRLTCAAAALYAPGETPRWYSDSVPEALLVPKGPWEQSLGGAKNLMIQALDQTPDLVPPALAATAKRVGFQGVYCCPIPVHSALGGDPGATSAGEGASLAVLVVWWRSERALVPLEVAVVERAGGLIYLGLLHRQEMRAHQERLEAERLQNQRLFELEATRTELFKLVAHELRTPLTSVLSYAELAGAERDRSLPAHLAAITRNARRIQRLVEDLGALASLESPEPSLRLSSLDLAPTVERVVHNLEPVAERSGIALSCRATSGHPLVGDPDRLAQLVENLVSNALKYTPGGGRVSVQARSRPTGWQVVVTDTGVGIPPGEIDRVFDQFYRASNVHEDQASGSGLGLTIVRSIARLHGGDVAVTSVEGVGSVFTVELTGASSNEVFASPT